MPADPPALDTLLLRSGSEAVLLPDGAGRVDARLDRAGLLDLTMEEAGRAVATAAQRLAPAGRVVLLAGGGANGGDALVAARHLSVAGRDVQVLAAPATHPLTRLNRRRLKAVGVSPQVLSPARLRAGARGAALLVDGLLGTGFRVPLRPAMEALIAEVNAARAQGAPVLAIDVPSGLEAGPARAAGPAVQADATVTLMGWKPALLFGEAATRAGAVGLTLLSVPRAWVAPEAVAARLPDALIGSWLPERPAEAHKGTAGRVWVLGGHPGTAGAPVLAGVGALRTGAGLVTLHSLAELPLLHPELMVRRHPSWPEALPALAASGLPDALAVGMGLGPDAAEVARAVLAWQVPTVLDADALQPHLAGSGHDRCVWTPHPGEAARLLDVPTAQVTGDPLVSARALQARLGGVVVLKGGPSVVAWSGGLVVARGGHPGMATAGMGDTLAGVIAALLGQGLDAARAALCGVRLHARAGERAAARHHYGLVAGDVAEELGGAWLDLRATGR